MRYRGPIVTLLAVATLAAVLLVVNVRTAAQTQIAGRVTDPAATGHAPSTVPPPSGRQPPAGTTPPSDDLFAPPDPSAPPPAAEDDQPAYAGRTSGNEATIAIVMRGAEVSAYICDGKRVESWLEGTITDGELSLQGSDDARVDGSVQGDAVFGTLWVQGRQWPYAAQRAEQPAGLYQGQGEVDGAPARIGWIVLQDGSQVGIADIGGVARPAPALDPYQLSSVEVGGSVIVPRAVDGTDDVANPPS